MDNQYKVPEILPNWVNGEQVMAAAGNTFSKLSPHNGEQICQVTRSQEDDVGHVVEVARQAQVGWSEMPAVQRGYILHQVCNQLEQHQEEIAKIVSLETGKSIQEAMGETGGAITLGRFYAGEGQRLYGRTTTSGVSNKYASTVRQPCGVAGLIIAANTPIANVAWKVFPALICGNGVVLKAAEDTPATAWIFSLIAHEAGLPSGVLNVIQGLGIEAGEPLVRHEAVDVISFTGSTAVGKRIAEIAGKRLAKVSLELGGKNPLVVCDDADMDNAVKWVCLSAFSNAGQRCAAGSRIIVFESIYEEFTRRLLKSCSQLRLGPDNDDDLGPVINERQLINILASIKKARDKGASILCGGNRMAGEKYDDGFYLQPTVVADAAPHDEISECELFGPVTVLYRARDFNHALKLANDSPYGLTACIHTANYHRAMQFSHKVKCGATVVNAGTYGSEPHMPFGGLRQSGNGTREPGTEALDIYTELKDIYMVVDPDQV